MTKAEAVREALSDLSETTCNEIYDAVLKGHLMEIGRLIDAGCEKQIVEHFEENRDRTSLDALADDAYDRAANR